MPIPQLFEPGQCDKCGGAVAPTDDAVLLDAICQGKDLDDPWIVNLRLNYSGRHLLPHIVNGEMCCVGSPSRAQYLPGQPRDTRGQYHTETEPIIRAAFAELQRAFSTPSERPAPQE